MHGIVLRKHADGVGSVTLWPVVGSVTPHLMPGVPFLPVVLQVLQPQSAPGLVELTLAEDVPHLLYPMGDIRYLRHHVKPPAGGQVLHHLQCAQVDNPLLPFVLGIVRQVMRLPRIPHVLQLAHKEVERLTAGLEVPDEPIPVVDPLHTPYRRLVIAANVPERIHRMTRVVREPANPPILPGLGQLLRVPPARRALHERLFRRAGELLVHHVLPQNPPLTDIPRPPGGFDDHPQLRLQIIKVHRILGRQRHQGGVQLILRLVMPRIEMELPVQRGELPPGVRVRLRLLAHPVEMPLPALGRALDKPHTRGRQRGQRARDHLVRLVRELRTDLAELRNVQKLQRARPHTGVHANA